jgi:hypothetical protein
MTWERPGRRCACYRFRKQRIQSEVDRATAHLHICPRQCCACARVWVQRLMAEHHHALGIVLGCCQFCLQMMCGLLHPTLVCNILLCM